MCNMAPTTQLWRDMLKKFIDATRIFMTCKQAILNKLANCTELNNKYEIKGVSF